MNRRLIMPALLAAAVAGLTAAVTGTALATTDSSGIEPGAPVGGVVPGLTGAAAVQDAGAAVENFRRVTADRIARRSTLAAAQLHTAWGTFFRDSASSGLQATHSVLTITTHGNDFVYAPTALPPGGACTEMTTAYTSSGPKLWAWDWCGGRDTIGKIVNIDSSFLNTYTTTVNGVPAYTMQEVQTSASNNAWTVYLYNFTTRAWDTFYATSGTKDIPGSSWDFFEIYTTINPATGAGYYCADAYGKAFEASSIQVSQNGAWTPANTANSSLSNPPAGSTFDCPSLTFTRVSANDHWLARIGPVSTTPPTTPTTTRPTTMPTTPPTTRPTTTPPTTTPPTSGACSATYTQVGSWPGGFQGTVTVTVGNAAITAWTVGLTMPSGVSISQLWSGTLSGSAPNYTVKNASFNGSVAANGSTSFGFLGSGTAAAPRLTCTAP
jgi:hypothetical protein